MLSIITQQISLHKNLYSHINDNIWDIILVGSTIYVNRTKRIICKDLRIVTIMIMKYLQHVFGIDTELSLRVILYTHMMKDFWICHRTFDTIKTRIGYRTTIIFWMQSNETLFILLNHTNCQGSLFLLFLCLAFGFRLVIITI